MLEGSQRGGEEVSKGAPPSSTAERGVVCGRTK